MRFYAPWRMWLRRRHDCSGAFYMIHRPHRLTDIMVLLRQYKLEPKRIRFVQPYADKWGADHGSGGGGKGAASPW